MPVYISKLGLAEKTLQFAIEILIFILGRGEREEGEEAKREYRKEQ